MAATMPTPNTITLNASGEKTSDIFPNGVLVDQITIVAGATPGATVITADGVIIFQATPSADTSVDVPLNNIPINYKDIVGTTLGTNVTCFVHVR